LRPLRKGAALPAGTRTVLHCYLLRAACGVAVGDGWFLRHWQRWHGYLLNLLNLDDLLT
jgi:hypothetical protein